MRRGKHQKSTEPGYEGSENLEIMQEAEHYNRFLEKLVRKFAIDTTSVLDFGAGIGTFTNRLGLPPDRVTCVEPDPRAQKQLTSKGFETHAGLSDIPDDSFTYIFSLNVLEHIEDDRKVVSELCRVLRPGGYLFIYVPAFEALYSPMDSYVGHFRRYNMKGLTGILKSAGFDIKRSAYTDALGFFAALAYKVFHRNSDGLLDKGAVRFYDRYLYPVSRLLSPPLSKTLGKNIYVVAKKPDREDRHQYSDKSNTP